MNTVSTYLEHVRGRSLVSLMVQTGWAPPTFAMSCWLYVDLFQGSVWSSCRPKRGVVLGPKNLKLTKMVMKYGPFGSFFLRPAGTIPLSAVHSEDVVCVEIAFYLNSTLEELDELFTFEECKMCKYQLSRWLGGHNQLVLGISHHACGWQRDALGALDRLIIDN